MDPSATCSGRASTRSPPIDWLGPLVFHAAAKDTRINENCKIYGVLDERFTRIPLEEHPTGPRREAVVNKWPADSAWDFVARRPRPRRRLLDPVSAGPARRVDPDMAVNIEHEDAALGRLEGLQVAAETLRAANLPTLQTLPPSDRPC